VDHKERMEALGALPARGGLHSLAAMRERIQRLLSALQADARLAPRMRELDGKLSAGVRTPALAVGELVEMMGLGRPSVGGSA